jgi:predicted alpha/beta hydrolase family esterase
MRVSDVDILIVPGWMNSDPDHWQSRWQSKLSTARRVMMPDFDQPVREEWVEALSTVVAACARPALLVAHSLGALTVAHAADRFPVGKVVGAWLAAPPNLSDLSRFERLSDGEGGRPESLRDFWPAPDSRLPFPAIVVASRNDPFCSFETACNLARSWGASLADAGEAGHINSASGYGPWPDGVLRLASFLREVSQKKGAIQ